VAGNDFNGRAAVTALPLSLSSSSLDWKHERRSTAGRVCSAFPHRMNRRPLLPRWIKRKLPGRRRRRFSQIRRYRYATCRYSVAEHRRKLGRGPYAHDRFLRFARSEQEPSHTSGSPTCSRARFVAKRSRSCGRCLWRTRQQSMPAMRAGLRLESGRASTNAARPIGRTSRRARGEKELADHFPTFNQSKLPDLTCEVNHFALLFSRFCRRSDLSRRGFKPF